MPASVEATIIREKDAQVWFAEFVECGQTSRLPITEADAWNFDIERGLKVKIKIKGKACRILSRTGNKRYVQIEE